MRAERRRQSSPPCPAGRGPAAPETLRERRGGAAGLQTERLFGRIGRDRQRGEEGGRKQRGGEGRGEGGREGRREGGGRVQGCITWEDVLDSQLQRGLLPGVERSRGSCAPVWDRPLEGPLARSWHRLHISSRGCMRGGWGMGRRGEGVERVAREEKMHSEEGSKGTRCVS